MAVPFLSGIDLNKTELRNAIVQNLAVAPSSPLAGQIYYDTALGHFEGYIGSWVRLDAYTAAEILTLLLTVDGSGSGLDSDLLDGQSSAYYLSRANHTSTQLAATISDFDTQVRLSRLDQMAVPTGSVSLNSQKITSLATPTSGTDAVNKNYVDAATTGMDWKASVRVASTANVSIVAAPVSIDGVTLTANDRILLKNQSTGSQNGLWVFASGGAALTRATDADASAEVTSGLAVYVSEGTVNAGSGWLLTTADPITVGSTSLAFSQFAGSATYTGGTGITITGNVITIDTAYVGQTSITTLGTITTGTWSATAIAVAKGGTGATDAATARTNLGLGTIATQAANSVSITGGTITGITDLTVADGGTGASTAAAARTNLDVPQTAYTALIGNGASTSIAVTQATHGRAASRALCVSVYDESTGAVVYPDVTISSGGTVTFGFSTAPTSNQYRVVIMG